MLNILISFDLTIFLTLGRNADQLIKFYPAIIVPATLDKLIVQWIFDQPIMFPSYPLNFELFQLVHSI